MTAEYARALTRSEMALHDFDNYHAHDNEPYEISPSEHKAVCRALSCYLSYLDRMSADLRRVGAKLPPDLLREKIDADELHNRILRSHRVVIEPEE